MLDSSLGLRDTGSKWLQLQMAITQSIETLSVEKMRPGTIAALSAEGKDERVHLCDVTASLTVPDRALRTHSNSNTPWLAPQQHIQHSVAVCIAVFVRAMLHDHVPTTETDTPPSVD